MVLPVPLEVRVTGTPLNGVLLPSRTVTVIVLLPCRFMVDGDAATVDFEALGVPAGLVVQLTAKLRSAVALPETITARGLVPLTTQLLATPLNRTV